MAWVNDDNAVLLTDLYELTMAAAYRDSGMAEFATFDLYVRRLPRQRSFLVACGLEQALDYLERLRFTDEDLDWLAAQPMFRRDFVDSLRNFRFTGDVWAIPEGELVFAEEPLLRVTAPVIEAQLVESFLLNCVLFQSLIASKAARISLACEGEATFVDFSLRRDHGADAALKAARAAFVGGATGTSNVLAAKVWDIPPSGTMAHSWVMAHDSEEEAFVQFARTFPNRAILLIDTYDTIEGARVAVRAARRLEAEGNRIFGVRLDSGDFATESREVRRILDEAGFKDARIVASGDLDEHRIAELRRSGAPIDAYGIGTQLGTSGDAPSLGGVYKLVEYADEPRIKLSPAKETLPGRKQVHRVFRDGLIERDILTLHDEVVPGGTPLLQHVMKDGKRLLPHEPLRRAQERCKEGLRSLPPELRRLDGAGTTARVEVSERLREYRDEARRMVRSRVGATGSARAGDRPNPSRAGRQPRAPTT